MPLLEAVREYIRNLALEPLENLLQSLQRCALLPTFQSVQRGLGNAELPSKGSIRRLAAFPAQKYRKLFIQREPHCEMLRRMLFRMRNSWIDLIP